MKRIGVCRENKFLSLAFAITALTCFTPELTADREKKGRLSCLDIMNASVVLPTPGGPHKMKDEILPVSIMFRRIAPLPTRCSCPTYSSKLLGLIRSANGIRLPAIFTFSSLISAKLIFLPVICGTKRQTYFSMIFSGFHLSFGAGFCAG